MGKNGQFINPIVGNIDFAHPTRFTFHRRAPFPQLQQTNFRVLQNVFYGAVTIGDVWRFGKLERNQQQITQDLNLFKVPDDLDSLVRVLLGILEGE